MNWHDLFNAIALVFILEGLMPFLAPTQYKQTIFKLAEQPDNTLRLLGLIFITVGTILINLKLG